jgi:hypothetical protein
VNQAGNWKPLVDRGADNRLSSEIGETLPTGTATRRLRIILTSLPDYSPIQVNEVRVLGVPIQ